MATHVWNYRKFSLWSEILGKLFTVVSRCISEVHSSSSGRFYVSCVFPMGSSAYIRGKFKVNPAISGQKRTRPVSYVRLESMETAKLNDGTQMQL